MDRLGGPKKAKNQLIRMRIMKFRPCPLGLSNISLKADERQTNVKSTKSKVGQMKGVGKSQELTTKDSSLQALDALVQKANFNSSHGGLVELEGPFKLFVENGPTITFPMSKDHEERLLAACSPAPFGRGQEEVLDDSYRKAVKLDGDQFSTSFELGSTDLLETIRAALLPDRRDVVLTAQKDKLNVYTQGGFFKMHQVRLVTPCDLAACLWKLLVSSQDNIQLKCLSR